MLLIRGRNFEMAIQLHPRQAKRRTGDFNPHDHSYTYFGRQIWHVYGARLRTHTSQHVRAHFPAIKHLSVLIHMHVDQSDCYSSQIYTSPSPSPCPLAIALIPSLSSSPNSPFFAPSFHPSNTAYSSALTFSLNNFISLGANLPVAYTTPG